MAVESGEFEAADGRTVAFTRYGVRGGHRLFLHYGTPGTRHLGPRMVEVIDRHGADVLVLDRPGYGASTRWPGRRIVDVVTDVVRLADLQGWDRFAVWGGSGGAPHALACAAMLPERVERCASVVGPAPFDAEGLDWFDGMSPGNVEEFTRALEGEASYRPLVERLARESVAAAEAGEVPFGEYELPESDLALLRKRMDDPGYLDRLKAAHLGGIDGWIDDCLAGVQPWGFAPQDIRVPVSVRYGPEDVLVPAAHGEWLASHIPGADRQLLPNGHVLDDGDLDAIYGWLVAEA
jgi:pimeloyl-ACP methyl ester carboxylesterase